jgi:hypothetical protein
VASRAGSQPASRSNGCAVEGNSTAGVNWVRYQPTSRATSTIAEVIWAISAVGQMYGGIA